MRKILALAVCGLAVASSAYAALPACTGSNAPCTRTFTGLAHLVDGTTVTTGKLVAVPYGTVSTDSVVGMVVKRPYTYTITSGALTCAGGCKIAAPLNYTFTLYVTESSRDKQAGEWQAGVAESSDPITMQDLYAAATTAVVVASDPMYAGEDLADGGSGTATDGYVLTADGTGGAAWEAAGGGNIEGVTAGDGLTGGGTTGTVSLAVGAGTGMSVSADAIGLANTAVSAGSYTLSSITVDAQGRLTAASSGSETGDISGVTAGTGLTGGGTSGTVTLSLGSHTHAGGDVTSAVASATTATTAGDGVSSATGTAPLTLGLAAKALTGSIAITPAASGGAVALQAASPGTQQTGSLNVSGIVRTGAGTGSTAGLSLGGHSVLASPTTSTLVLGAESAQCTVTGASYSSATLIGAVAHGCQVEQGDLVVVWAAANSANLGVYTGVGGGSWHSFPDVIGIAGRPFVNTPVAESGTVSLTVYDRGLALDPDGRMYSMADINDATNAASIISYGVDQATGTGMGLNLFFGAHLQDYQRGFYGHNTENWGTGETSHEPFSIYRSMYRDGDIFRIDALGNTTIGGDIIARSTGAEFGVVTAHEIATGAAPTISRPVGSAGSTTWTYVYVPVYSDGSHGPASAAGSITNGCATLSASCYNRITIPSHGGDTNVFAFDVYRTAAGTSPSTVGLLWDDLQAPMHTTKTAYAEDWGQALVTIGASAPSDNTTGVVVAEGSLHAGADNDTASVYVHDAGTVVLYDDGDDTSVTIGPVGDGTTVATVTGTLNATGLQVGGTAVSVAGHTHAASDVTSGALDAARLATGTATDGYVIKSAAGTPTWSAAPSAAVVALKTAAESVNNSNTLQDDDHLVVALAASKTYLIEGLLIVTAASATPDFSIGWSVPTGMTGKWSMPSLVGRWTAVANGNSPSALADQATSHFSGLSSGTYGLAIWGLFTTSSTAGSLQLRWSQYTATAENVTVEVSSFIRATPLN